LGEQKVSANVVIALNFVDDFVGPQRQSPSGLVREVQPIFFNASRYNFVDTNSSTGFIALAQSCSTHRQVFVLTLCLALAEKRAPFANKGVIKTKNDDVIINNVKGMAEFAGISDAGYMFQVTPVLA
jgi:hypothetical protein